jgi:hypothetical protein
MPSGVCWLLLLLPLLLLLSADAACGSVSFTVSTITCSRNSKVAATAPAHAQGFQHENMQPCTQHVEL